jgi:hypothetical protein
LAYQKLLDSKEISNTLLLEPQEIILSKMKMTDIKEFGFCRLFLLSNKIKSAEYHLNSKFLTIITEKEIIGVLHPTSFLIDKNITNMDFPISNNYKTDFLKKFLSKWNEDPFSFQMDIYNTKPIEITKYVSMFFTNKDEAYLQFIKLTLKSATSNIGKKLLFFKQSEIMGFIRIINKNDKDERTMVLDGYDYKNKRSFKIVISLMDDISLENYFDSFLNGFYYTANDMNNNDMNKLLKNYTIKVFEN